VLMLNCGYSGRMTSLFTPSRFTCQQGQGSLRVTTKLRIQVRTSIRVIR
jgi:hypothetical protein